MRLKEYPFHCVDIDCCAGNLSPLQWAVNQNWLPFRLFEIEGFARFCPERSYCSTGNSRHSPEAEFIIRRGENQMFTSLRNLQYVCLASLFALISSVSPGQATPPSADTFVSSAVPSHNFGNSTILAVQPGATSYLRFNLATLPAGATVNKASLRLYVDAAIMGGTFDVYQLNNSWSENTLTYNTP